MRSSWSDLTIPEIIDTDESAELSGKASAVNMRIAKKRKRDFSIDSL
jgi:hypothetical protein